jgi:hypothetical protein
MERAGQAAASEATEKAQRRASVELEPETVLPAQFFSRTQIDAGLQPEKRLMLAVLEDAVGTYQKYALARDRRAQALFVEAEAWFASDDTEWPYAFLNVCHALDIEVDYLRQGLRRWRDSQHAASQAGAKVLRFPFRRVNGTRHQVTGRPVGLRRSA